MRRPLLIILGVALVLRVGFVLATTEYAPRWDAADYDRIGQTLADTGGLPPTVLADPGTATAYRPPAYPAALALVYEVTGKRYTAGRLVNALLGTLSVLLLYLLAARVFDRRTALWSAALLAVAPPLIWLSGALLSENLAIPLVLGMALCVAAYRDTPRMRLAAGAGVLLGLAILTRSNAAVLALPLVLGLAGVRQATVALACAAVVLVPWTIRNASEFHRVLPLGTQSGYTMAGQWNAAATDGGVIDADWLLPQSLPQYRDLFSRPGTDEGDLDAALRSRAIDFATAHPVAALKAVTTNLVRTIDLQPSRTTVAYEELGVTHRWVWLLRVCGYALVLLSVAGLVIGGVRPYWFWSIPLLILLATIPWIGSPRYATALYPFLAIAAAVALQAAVRSRPGR